MVELPMIGKKPRMRVSPPLTSIKLVIQEDDPEEDDSDNESEDADEHVIR